MQIDFKQNAYRRDEKRFSSFGMQFYHEKTKGRTVKNVYRAGETHFREANCRYYHENTMVEEVQSAYRLDETLIFIQNVTKRWPKRVEKCQKNM